MKIWAIECWSWRKPGRVSSRETTPPPSQALRSSTSTRLPTATMSYSPEADCLSRSDCLIIGLSQTNCRAPLMGDSNTQSEATVRKFFELLNAEDLEGVRALLTEDAGWIPQARDMPGAGAYHGRNVIVDEFLKPIRGLFAKGSPSNKILSMAS